jgi:predicted DNA-binding mobile mystery protein A
MDKQRLLLQQLNARMAAYDGLKQVGVPATGWIKAIRSALGMSLQQLGKRISITKQSMLEMEQREREGTITLNSLKELAKALDMQLVYGFVPYDGTLEALIDRKAKELANQIVMRTAHSMQLEDQQNSNERLEKAIEERAQSIKNETPKILWD